MGTSSRHAPAAVPLAAGAGVPFSRFTRVDVLPPGSSGESYLVEAGGERLVLKAIGGPRLEAQRLRMLDETEALAHAVAGVAPFTEVELRADGRLHLLRPYVAGQTLAERFERRRPALADALSIGRAILEVLARVHAAGVIHRNLKPSNVIIGADGAVTLVDIGMSHDLSTSGEGSDSLARLARYVSPEQAGLVYQGVQEATDLYLFGLVLYEAVAGVPAYDGDSFGDVLRRHLTAPVPSTRTGGLRVPRALDDVIARLLRKDPRDRYRTAAGVLADLDEIAKRLAAGEHDPELVIGAYDRRERLTEPGFIGRARELTALSAAVEDARRGTGSLVCLEAASGGGKTRLLEELARRADHRGLWVMHGRGQDLVASRPLRVLDGVVDDIVARARKNPAEAAALRARLDVRAEHAAIALPALAPVLLQGPAPEAGPEAFGETRTLQAVARLFDALGSPDRPVVVLLDDCQWADELSVKLLTRWAVHPPATSGRYVSIVAAYRSEEVASEHALRQLPVRQITLAPFTPEEVHGLLESMAGPVPEEARDLVVRLAQGNAFMACAVLRGLVESGALAADAGGWRIEAPAIADVRSSGHAVAMLHRRLELLPPPALQLLTAAAVLGKEFDLASAQDLARQGSGQALAALAEARARHIVWPSQRDRRYVFTHDKLRETLLERLSADERRRLHLEAAVRIEQSEGQRPVYDLAYHFDAAGEAERAFPYALAAADEARARNALEIAERYYRIAERGAGGEAAHTRYRTAVGLGDVLMLRGEYEEAGRAFERARACAETPLARAELEGKVGELAFKRGDPRQGYLAISKGLRLLHRRVPRNALAFAVQSVREIVVQALHTLFPELLVARREEPTLEELVAIRLYSRLTYAFWFTQGTLPTLWAHLRGMNLAERHRPTAELAQAYSEHAPVMTMIPWLDRGLRYAARSLELRKDLADVWGQGQSLHFLGIVHYAAGRYREAIEACQEAARILDRTGDRWEAFTARWHVAIAMYRLGDLDAAVAEVRRVYEGAVEIGDRQIRGITLGIWAKASEGRVPEELLRRELAEESDDVHTTAELLMAEATRQLRAGRPEEAADALREARARVREKGLRQEYVAPVLAWLATALRMQAERVAPWAERERHAVRRRLRRAVRGALRIARSYRNNLPHALREAGYLAAMDGRAGRARRALDRSLAVARELGARYEEALTLEAVGRIGTALAWPDANDSRLRAERLLAELRDGLQETDAGASTTLSVVDRFASTVESGRRIASALSADAVCASTCTALTTLLRCEETAVLLVDEAAAGASARLGAGKLGGPVCAALIDRAVAERRAITYSADVPGDFDDAPELADAASALCAPVLSRGRVVACLYAVHRKVAGLFAADEERLVAFVATIAGAALENAEGFSRLQELNALLDARSKELERSNRELTQFAYVASHDLQEPLRNVASYVQLLEDRYGAKLDEKARRYISGAVEGVERMRSLISDLLAYSRVTSRPKPMEATDFGAVFDDVVRTFAPSIAEAKAEVTRGALPVMQADRSQVAQLFQNLISNALKFRGAEPPRIHATAEYGADEWTFTVRDNGIGLDTKYGEQIFVIFKRLHTRTEYPGTGIGLAICAKIVERHGGRIWVESKPGEGSSFKFTLPMMQPSAGV